MSKLPLNTSNYVQSRWKPAHERFEREAQINQFASQSLTGLILISSVAALLVGSFGSAMQMGLLGLSLVSIAIFVLYDFRGKAQHARHIADALRREHEMFQGNFGIYDNTQQAMARFMRRCEAIILSENGVYLPFILAESDDKEANTSSSTTSRSPFSSTSSRSDSPLRRFGSASSFPSRTSGSSPFSRASANDDTDDDDDDDDTSSSSSSSSFSGRFGSRPPSSGSPFGRSSNSPFSRSSSSGSPFNTSPPSRFGANRPIGSSGGMRREGNDDPALANLSSSNGNTGVRFLAYYPKEMGTKNWAPIKAYAFMGYALDAVQADAKGDNIDKLPEVLYDRNHTSRYKIPEGAQVTVTPHMKGFQFNPQSVNIGFYRTWHRFDFEMRAVDATLDEATNGHLTFTVDGLIVADVPMSVFVSKSLDNERKPTMRQVARKPYRSVYASFADADIYLAKRFAEIYESLGMYNMRDVMQVRQENGWNEDLVKAVDEAEVFQVFWSESAAQSETVAQELNYGLARRDATPNFIRVVYWEQPPATLPDSLTTVPKTYLPDISSLS